MSTSDPKRGRVASPCTPTDKPSAITTQDYKQMYPLTEETYRHMWMLRYQQHMGQITFLELLDKYEKLLGIRPRSASEQ